MHSSTLRLRSLYGLLALIAGATAPLAAQYPNIERGVETHSAYDFETIDKVDLLSGNLLLTLPLGERYPVGGELSYRLQLLYNAKIWDHEEAGYQGDLYSKAVPHKGFNAGLGWTISLGELRGPRTASEQVAYSYVGPDGTEHTFYSQLHAPNAAGTYCADTCYTRDGTYIRMRKLSDTSRVVELPDGTQHSFARYSDSNGWAWRITSIDDRFADGLRDLTITYSTDGNTWTLTDKHNRVQRVIFEADPSGAYPRRLQRVELTAFGGTTATYSLSYLPTQSVRVPCTSHLPFWTHVNVSLLSSLVLPDGSSFGFTYHHPTDGGDCNARGVIASMRLPTLGTISYGYRLNALPVLACSYREWHAHSLGVATRTLRDAAGAELGVWSYSSVLSTSPPSGNQFCEPLVPFSAPAEELQVTVVTPRKDKTVHYFSVWPGAELPVTTSFRPEEYGLPITRRVSDAGGRFLSSQIYDCNSSGAQCVLKRSVYRRYDVDESCSLWNDACSDKNRRMAAERTVFHDDGDRYAGLDASDFDGFGHYRSINLNGSFGAGNTRTEVTNYNPGNVLPGSAWILGTYTEKVATEGTSAKQLFCFDAATGALLRERRYKTGTSASGADVIVARTYDSAGNLIREQHYGGDNAGLSTTAALCTMTLPADAYRVDHGWSHGALATTQWVDGAGVPLSFYSVQRTNDRNTGLPTTTTDPAGLTTSYEYDALGRPTWVKPPVGHGSWVEYTYAPATSATVPATLTIQQRDNGSKTATIRARQAIDYDAFGRVWRERQLMPDATWNLRETSYDAMGSTTAVSEIQSGTATAKTEYLGFDPFGRPATIRPPDGATHDATFTYAGARLISRAAKVGTLFSAGSVTEASVTVTEEYDRQGRLWKLTKPGDGAGEQVTTRQTYGVGGQIIESCILGSGSTCVQRRVFTYDNRGFLTDEQHPEKGASGDGTVTYRQIDARGNARRVTDGASDLNHTYDRAGRRVSTREQAGAMRSLLAFTYGTASTASDWKNGKLASATRYNYVTVGATTTTYQVQESYTYNGRDGRPSRRDTAVTIGGVTSGSFTQSFTYDALGNLSSIGYPECVGCPTPAARTISPTYSEGRLVSVPGFSSSISYHANGMIHQVVRGNGTTDTHTRDANWLERPAAINAKRGTTTLWATGGYAYDGIGSVTGIGASWFEYFPSGRLKVGRLLDNPTGGGTERKQSYTYDVFGNVLSVTTQVAGGTPVVRNTPTSATSNRLGGTTSYDTSGNLTSWNGASYQYDPLQGMVRMTSGSQDWAYAYSASGERVLSEKLGGTRNRRWTLRDLDGKVLRDYVESGQPAVWTVDRDYIYRDGVALAAVTPEGVRHFHVDHLGTPRLITDAAGNQSAYHLYYPYGEEATSPTQDGERKKLTGHERDLNATGGVDPAADDLDYLHARFYNPQLARFLAVDPGRDLTAWSLYAYGASSPLTFRDPDGKRVSVGVRYVNFGNRLLNRFLSGGHAFFIIEPTGANRERFRSITDPTTGQITLGAYNRDGVLTKGMNDPSDRGTAVQIFPVRTPPGMNDEEFEQRLILAFNGYDDDFDYAAFPDEDDPQDGNCLTFLASMAAACGLQPEDLPHFHQIEPYHLPGWPEYASPRRGSALDWVQPMQMVTPEQLLLIMLSLRLR